MSGDTKRKSKSNTSRPARSKVSQDRKLEGIYNNARFVHIAASLVGHVVQVQVRDGEVFEGVFRTVSPELEVVLETAHPVEPGAQSEPSSLSRLLTSLGRDQRLVQLMIFRLSDVVSLCAPNADLDYATRDSFTDTAISKFNGQLGERPLEPWMDGGNSDSIGGLDDPPLDGEDTNGWDANEMFKTNAEKYGVTTSYDSALSSYTVKLEPKNTDEYKLQEAKASKIAQEIESNPVFKKRIEVENGDEEDKYSAVVRPSGDNAPQGARYVRRKPLGGSKPLRGTPPPAAVAAAGGPPRGGLPGFKGGLGSPSSSSPSAPLPPKPHHPPKHGPPHTAAAFPELDTSPRLNGAPKLEKEGPLSPGLCEGPVPDEASGVALADEPPAVDKGPADRKGPPPPLQKGRVQEIEEFKKFSTSIKLDEGKESKETTGAAAAAEEEEKERKEMDEAATAKEETDRLVKKSTLNPNAKEFVLNPNAKAFTPRTLLPLTSPPNGAGGSGGAVATTPTGGVRLSSSPLVGPPSAGVGQAPPQQLMPTGQHIITMAPQYLMPATPVSVAQFAPGQGPRFRKAMPLVQTRHDLPASMHVAAATGQPILAPAGLPNAPQLMVQYTPAQGMMHPSGPPQATVAYQQAQCFGPLAQMYPMVGHRVMSPQPMGMVAATHTASYGDATHLPAQVYMLQGQGHQATSTGGGPHSSPPTPGASTPVGGAQAGTPPVVYHPPPPPSAGSGPPPPPQPNLVLVPHSGANTPPHLMPHSPMVPPQLATAHFVHHQVFPRLLPPGV
uniref:Ataxin-2 n=1 Tax=Rhipicephalus zambeziensis TaxID=60191 RepID=A0A224YTY6_9ACAR